MSGLACIVASVGVLVLCVQLFAGARVRVRDYDGQRVPDEGSLSTARALVQGRNQAYAELITPSIAGVSVPSEVPNQPPEMDGSPNEEKLAAPPKPPWLE